VQWQKGQRHLREVFSGNGRGLKFVGKIAASTVLTLFFTSHPLLQFEQDGKKLSEKLL
jgi:hypothetical protein